MASVSGIPSAVADVGVAAAGQQQPGARPVAHLSPGHPAGAEHHVGVLQRGQQPRQLLRRVRAVGVHLDHDVVARGRGACTNPAT